MLSSLIVASQKLVLVKDELGYERISEKFVSQILKEQGEESCIKTLYLNEQLSDPAKIQDFLSECNDKPAEENKSWNVILPNLSDFLSYQKISFIFRFISNLKKCRYVKRIFLWISLPHLEHDHPRYVVAAFEYMADMVLHFLSSNELSLLVSKPGGGVTFKYYTYERKKTEINVQIKQRPDKADASNLDITDGRNMEQLGTFKIELDEEEIVARNAMKMPYEKAKEATESNIIYTPDAADDFDQEDPDEDLDL